MLLRWYSLFQHYFPCDKILVRRMFKSIVNTTIAFIFTLIPKVSARLGTEPAMLPLISVIVHPGRRVGGTIKGAIYCTTGLIFGLAYSIFGRFLAQQCMGSNWNKYDEVDQYKYNFHGFRAGLAILAVFESIMLFVHGWMRVINHFYFGIVFPLFLVVHFAFMASLTESAGVIAKSFSDPFYMGIGMSIFWNLVLFPEFGSTYLGNATVETFNEIHNAIDESIKFFISLDHCIYPADSSKPITLSKLLKLKSGIENKVNSCDLVLDESIYEISYSYVPPTKVIPLLENFKQLTISINGLINAGQLEFVLLGERQNEKNKTVEAAVDNIHKEITFANPEELLTFLQKLKTPIYDLHKALSQGIYTTKLILSYDFDVNFEKVTTSNTFHDFIAYRKKKDFKDVNNVQVLQENIDSLISILNDFDTKFMAEMNRLNILTPNDEMFLLSSFLINLKETTNAIINIMQSTKEIHELRINQENKGWLRGKRVWFTFMRNFDSFKRWLFGSTSGITESEGLKGTLNTNVYDNQTELVVRRPDMEEEAVLKAPQKEKLPLRLPQTNAPEEQAKLTSPPVEPFTYRVVFAWIDKFCRTHKPHFRFAFQVVIALMVASFPMFIAKTRHWYIEFKGTWIGFVCILCLESSIGGTFWVFFLRAVGVIAGSAWAYLSYAAGIHRTNPYLETVITVFGAIPGFYFYLGTPYVKAAIIYIISIYIVILGAKPGSILLSFAKRCLAVGYGGGVALIVQVFFFPIKARDQLNEEISFVCSCISKMELIFATGLEGEKLTESLTDINYKRFAKISSSAKAALGRASAYKGLTRQEPRLKGEYTELENIFTEIIFIQKQIIERLDNVALMRNRYGSAIIEELNDVVYPYRRQSVATIVCIMRAIQEAFNNKIPLPQFLPSAKIAHRKLINEVRIIIQSRYHTQIRRFQERTEAIRQMYNASDDESSEDSNISPGNSTEQLTMKTRQEVNMSPQDYFLREKFLSWNASSSATEEIIEYIEELLRLTKILVGVNEFKYGFLSRPLYEDWAAEAVRGFDDFISGSSTRKESNERIETTTESVLNESNESLTSEGSIQSDESNNVVAYEPRPKVGTAINLARIASQTAGKNQPLPKKFRDRTFSIGSRVGMDAGDRMSSIERRRTLGDPDPNFNDDEEESGDEELPLALKMIVNRKAKRD